MSKLLPRSDLDDAFDMFPGVKRDKGLSRVNVRGSSISPASVQGTLMRAAADVVKRQQPAWTRNARQLAIANGWFESYLGGAGSFAPDGVPSWNWGAVMARAGEDFISHGDHKADGTAFTGRYAKYPNMTEGFLGYLKRINKDVALIKAMQVGDAYGMAYEMFRIGYYSNVDPDPIGDPRGSTDGDRRRVQGYANALARTAKSVAKALGEPDTLVSGASGGHGYLSPVGNDLASAPDVGSTAGGGSGATSGVTTGLVAAGVVTGALLGAQALTGAVKARR